MKISLMHEKDNKIPMAWDPTYGKSFMIHSVLINFLNEPIEKYADKKYFVNYINNSSIEFNATKYYLPLDDTSPYEIKNLSKDPLSENQYLYLLLRYLVNGYIYREHREKHHFDDDEVKLKNQVLSGQLDPFIYGVGQLHKFKQSLEILFDENFVRKDIKTPHDLHSKMDYSISVVNGNLIERYGITSIESYCLLAISKLAISNIRLKRCDNCGKFFVPWDGLEIYCDNIFKDGKTCKEIAPSLKYRSDPLKKYGKKLHDRYTRWNDSSRNYELRVWQRLKNKYLREYSSGKLEPDLYEKWLKASEKEMESNKKIRNKELSIVDFENWFQGDSINGIEDLPLLTTKELMNADRLDALKDLNARLLNILRR